MREPLHGHRISRARSSAIGAGITLMRGSLRASVEHGPIAAWISARITCWNASSSKVIDPLQQTGALRLHASGRSCAVTILRGHEGHPGDAIPASAPGAAPDAPVSSGS